MDDIIIWLAPLLAILGAVVGWLIRSYYLSYEMKRKAALDASQILVDKKHILEELIISVKDDEQKKQIYQQLEEVNTALLNLLKERLRRTFTDAGLSIEKALIASSLKDLPSQQVDNLIEEIIEIENAPKSKLIWNLLAQANAYYSAGNYSEAKQTYNEVLSLSPNNAIALRNRGNTNMKLGLYDEAFEDYQILLDLHPNDPDLYYIHGIISTELGRYDEALSNFDHALELKPGDSDILNNRGVVYKYLGKNMEAINDFNNSLEISPDNPDTLNNRGVIFAKLKKYNEALADYTKAIEFDPNNAEAFYNRGVTNTVLEKYNEAVTDLTKAIELKPNYAEAYYNRGDPLRWLGQWDNAIADFKKAVELNPKLIGSYYIIACYYSLRHQVEDALKYLEIAISKDKKFKEMAKTEKDFNNIRDDPRFKKLID